MDMETQSKRITFDPENNTIYAGLAGIKIDTNVIELGLDIRLEQTYAHILGANLAFFGKPTKQGNKNSLPVKPIGGKDFDIYTQLVFPYSTAIPCYQNRLTTLWLITALIRLYTSTVTTVPIVADQSLTDVVEDQQIILIAMEKYAFHSTDPTRPSKVSEDTLIPVRKNWPSVINMMQNSESFRVAFSAFDASLFEDTIPIGMMTLWGGLERLFSVGNLELRFRIAAYIAAYLEPQGVERITLFKSIKGMYDARSRVAHGSRLESSKDFVDTWSLYRRVIKKVIETNTVPSQNLVEELLFSKRE
ncbi:MAG: hypothetical protein ACYCZF_04440 [Anaerolineae bacterium]